MATLPSPPGGVPPEDFFLGNLKLIEGIVDGLCRRYHFTREEVEDFASHVKLKFIENDYSIIRQYKGNCSPRTYLTVVISRQLKDYQDRRWGKFRSSAEALRLGPLAIDLERLMKRDGHTFDEACEKLKDRATAAELAEIWAKLKPRVKWREVDEEDLESEPGRDPNPEEQLEKKERGEISRRVYRALARAVETLSKEDKLFLKLRGDGFKVSEIARIWKVDQKPLYRRQDKIQKTLFEDMQRQGIRQQDIEDALRDLAPDDPDDPDNPDLET